MAKLVSKVYGDALFSLATEENQVDELWEEAAMVHGLDCDDLVGKINEYLALKNE